jgi:hypothetical protein
MDENFRPASRLPRTPRIDQNPDTQPTRPATLGLNSGSAGPVTCRRLILTPPLPRLAAQELFAVKNVETTFLFGFFCGKKLFAQGAENRQVVANHDGSLARYVETFPSHVETILRKKYRQLGIDRRSLRGEGRRAAPPGWPLIS